MKTSEKKLLCFFGAAVGSYLLFAATLGLSGRDVTLLPPLVQGKAGALLSTGDTGLPSGRLLSSLQLLTDRTRR